MYEQSRAADVIIIIQLSISCWDKRVESNKASMGLYLDDIKENKKLIIEFELGGRIILY
jgi:hypothetical protein